MNFVKKSTQSLKSATEMCFHGYSTEHFANKGGHEPKGGG